MTGKGTSISGHDALRGHVTFSSPRPCPHSRTRRTNQGTPALLSREMDGMHALPCLILSLSFLLQALLHWGIRQPRANMEYGQGSVPRARSRLRGGRRNNCSRKCGVCICACTLIQSSAAICRTTCGYQPVTTPKSAVTFTGSLTFTALY